MKPTSAYNSEHILAREIFANSACQRFAEERAVKHFCVSSLPTFQFVTFFPLLITVDQIFNCSGYGIIKGK